MREPLRASVAISPKRESVAWAREPLSLEQGLLAWARSAAGHAVYFIFVMGCLNLWYTLFNAWGLWNTWYDLWSTSASIRWIWLDYMYPDESSQSLVYYLRIHNMFGWYIYCLDCVIACDCLMNYFYSSLPCLLVWLSCMWFFFFCDDHQFIDVSRCERHSRSTRKGWSCCVVCLDWFSYFGFYYRAMTHVLLGL